MMTTKLNKSINSLIIILILIPINCFANNTEERISNSDSILINYFKENNIEIAKNNELHILKSGHEKFVHLFKDIENAKHHIHLEYFNFRNDSIANKLFDLLEKKVKEGVKVRAIFDAFGNWSNNKPLKKKHLRAYQEAGIEIVKFDPIRFPWINHAYHRDHRKIAIIDGKIGYTGGMNIADYYITGLPEIGEWRDMHVRIEGDAVQDMQKIFLDMWKKCTKQEINEKEYFPYEYIGYTPTQEKKVAIVDRYPRRTPKIIRRTYANAIENAENSVQIINPYFTPTPIIRKAIKKAVDKGVKVEIMIPGKSDIKFSPDAALYIANKLRKEGANIYIFNGGFHHSKIMMVDSIYCTIGSANLNSRSLFYDFETNAFIFDNEETEELIGIFEEDKKNSTLLTSEMYKKRSLWKKFVGWFAHLFTPFI